MSRSLVPILVGIAIAGGVAAAAVSYRPARSLPVLEGVDRVVVATSGSDVREAEAGPALDGLVAFANARRSGWRRRWDTPPSPSIRVLFYRDGTLVDGLGAGDGWFMALGEGRPMRRASDAEGRELGRLVAAVPLPDSTP